MTFSELHQNFGSPCAPIPGRVDVRGGCHAVFARAPSPASAVIGTIDYVPAATLLLPYFEVDLNDPNGPQTSFTVVNTGAAPTTVKVTLWTDYAVPSFHFDLYLGGRDTVEVDLGLLLTKGILPQTGSNFGSPGPLAIRTRNSHVLQRRPAAARPASPRRSSIT